MNIFNNFLLQLTDFYHIHFYLKQLEYLKIKKQLIKFEVYNQL